MRMALVSDDVDFQSPDAASPNPSSSIHDAVGAYALNALPMVDRYAFEAHLAECGDCRREYARFEAVAVFLPRIFQRIDDGLVLLPNNEVSPERLEKSKQLVTDTPDSLEIPAVSELKLQPESIGSLELIDPDQVLDSSDSTNETKEEQPADSSSEPAEAEVNDAELTDSAIETAEELPDLQEKPADDLPTEPTPVDQSVPSTDVAPEGTEQTATTETEAARNESEEVDSGIVIDDTEQTVTKETEASDNESEEVDSAGTETVSPETSPEPSNAKVRSRRRRPQGRITTGEAPDASTPPALEPGSSKWWWIATTIIGVLGLVSFVTALYMMQQNGDLKTERDSLEQQIAGFEAEQQQYLDQTPAIVYELAPTTLGSPDSSGSIFVDPSGNSAILTVSGMPAQPADRTYPVFYLTSGSDISVAGPILTVDNLGNGVIAIDSDITSVVAVGITIEPSGGSTVPSSNPVLQAVIQP
jgi:Anti-sigma-K factor rskA, C-terminal/Putative zinc-finger